jgi:hypothetical protein
MKKVAFIRKDRGCSTPEMKAEALKKYAHLESIVRDEVTGDIIKYYTWDVLSEIGKCAEVVVSGNRIISVRNVPEANIRHSGASEVLFGGF